jgi:hypothetical protein
VELYFYAPTRLHCVNKDITIDNFFTYNVTLRRVRIFDFLKANYQSSHFLRITFGAQRWDIEMLLLKAKMSSQLCCWAMSVAVKKYRYDIFAQFCTNLNFHDILQLNLRYNILGTSIQLELSWYVREDGSTTHMTKLISAFHSFANAPKNRLPSWNCT